MLKSLKSKLVCLCISPKNEYLQQTIQKYFRFLFKSLNKNSEYFPFSVVGEKGKGGREKMQSYNNF